MRWLNFENALITKDEGQSTNYKVRGSGWDAVYLMTYMRSSTSSFVLCTYYLLNYEARIRLGCLHLRKSFCRCLIKSILIHFRESAY
jgi:hypothetical protein